MIFPVTEHFAKTDRHTTFYLSCGADDAPLIVFVHGWPELSISWRHQLPCFADLGFRAVAPDMRGYGRSERVPGATRTTRWSTIVRRHARAARRARAREGASGSATTGAARWSGALASHHPERCVGVANLCVPYFAKGFAPEITAARWSTAPSIRPSEYPAGQWDYQLYYEESFDAASAAFEADVREHREGAVPQGQPARRAASRRARPACAAKAAGSAAPARRPTCRCDTDVLTEDDLEHYVAALSANGFFGPDAWYMNRARNVAYAQRAPNGGRLDHAGAVPARPATTTPARPSTSRSPSRCARTATNLTELTVPIGPLDGAGAPGVSTPALARWLAQKFPSRWRV